jgi:glycosyltransferase involved in cell wall biosynthesis
MRILLSSNAPWSSTGYGVQVKSLLPRLAQLPVVGGADNLACFAWYGLNGGMMQAGPFTIYPGLAHPYGVDMIGHHAQHHRADVVITLIDVWTQVGVADLVAPAAWLPWFPVDTDPVSPAVLERLEGAALPLVYSRFGEQQLQAAAVACRYVPHGVEPGVFRIMDTPEEAAQVKGFRRHVAGAECTHLAVMVAANKGFPDRKAFAPQLRAWAAFAHDKPGARLYIHTDPTTQAGGADLLRLVKALDIEHRVIFCDRYQYYMGYPDQYMALLYNAADVLLGASMTEGFGLPLIEAQACGCPVLTTHFASMPELVRFGRATQPVDLFWSFEASWWAWPDWRLIRERLEEMHALQVDDPKAWCDASLLSSFAIHDEFSWDVIVDRYWRPALEAL